MGRCWDFCGFAVCACQGSLGEDGDNEIDGGQTRRYDERKEEDTEIYMLRLCASIDGSIYHRVHVRYDTLDVDF